VAITAATNFTGGNAFNYATDDGDNFDRTHVSAVAQALDNYDGDSGAGKAVKRVQTTVAPTAAGHVRVNGDTWQWWGSSAAAVMTAADTSSTQTFTNKTLTAPTINGGTHTAITSLGIRSTGAAFDLTLASTEVFTAGRTLTLILNDGNKTLNLAGNLVTSGANSLTLTTTGATNVTFPTTGTLATLAGSETLSAKVLTTPTINGAKWARRSVTSADSPVTLLTTNTILYCDCSSGAITVNLPTAVGNDGLTYWIKKTDAGSNAVTIDPNGAETVDDAASLVISSYLDSYTVNSDNAEWWVI
jgi:hypothetical protein